jgi:hypothetical protein
MSTGLTLEGFSFNLRGQAEQIGYKGIVARSTISSIQGMSLRVREQTGSLGMYSSKNNRRSDCF